MKRNSENQLNRRAFLQCGLAIPAALAIGSAVVGKVAYAEELKFVPDTDPVAKALGYVADATKADPKKRIAKMGVDGAKQNCANCQLFTAKGKIGKDEAGKCTMIQAGMVAANGWCTSWVKKA